MKTSSRVIYRLKIKSNYLCFEEHGDWTSVFVSVEKEDAVEFSTEAEAISAVVNDFYFHHGLGDEITKEMTAKERLEKIKIEKVIVTEEVEEIITRTNLPTNQEISEFYISSRGDKGLSYYIEPTGKLKKDGYELISAERLRLMRRI